MNNNKDLLSYLLIKHFIHYVTLFSCRCGPPAAITVTLKTVGW